MSALHIVLTLFVHTVSVHFSQEFDKICGLYAKLSFFIQMKCHKKHFFIKVTVQQVPVDLTFDAVNGFLPCLSWGAFLKRTYCSCYKKGRNK